MSASNTLPIGRAEQALTTDAITHANSLLWTATATVTATAVLSNNTGAPVDVELCIDVGGAGTTLRYPLAKALSLGARSTLPLPGFVVVVGDKVRVRASAVGVDVYLSYSTP